MALQEEQVREALKQVIDPELFVNIVDLGLIYVVDVKPADEDGKQLDKVKGTLQAVLPGREETFTFKSLGDLEDGVAQTKSGATVTFHGYEKNEDLFAVMVELLSLIHI